MLIALAFVLATAIVAIVWRITNDDLFQRLFAIAMIGSVWLLAGTGELSLCGINDPAGPSGSRSCTPDIPHGTLLGIPVLFAIAVLSIWLRRASVLYLAAGGVLLGATVLPSIT